MKSAPILIAIAIAVGGFIPVQGAINATLSQYTNHPLQATLINFIGGFIITFLILIILANPLPSPDRLFQAPWYAFLSGILGALFVTSVLLLIPEIGAANLLAATFFGQMLVATLMDHYGWLNLENKPITLDRVIGLVLILGGLYFLNRPPK